MASITDANGDLRLPDGDYRICFEARRFQNGQLGGVVSQKDILGRCADFTVVCSQTINGSTINTNVNSPASPLIAQFISGSSINSSIQFKDPSGCANTPVKLFGRIERISPSPFTVMLDPQYNLQQPLLINPGRPQTLTPSQILDAFENFNDNNLVITGIDLASIKDATNNIKLPDGNYRICFYARYITPTGVLGGNASDPNLGCGSFTICNQAGGAPQFTQPVNNLNINSEIPIVRPASPVIFTWLPPQSTCGLLPGGFVYDLEIWELFANQNVTDAINNPFVFRKTALPSTTFLLDTNLNRNVLQEGKRYAIRVRAVSRNANSPVDIDNNGYSRIEAFQYGSNLNAQNGSPDPHDYYIPFKERKSGFWDDIYTAVKKHSRSDTLVPIKEYIAFALTQNVTAYNLDAIDLFLALNPELADVKKVKISYSPQLPVFPVVAENDRMNFNKEHQVNLEPYGNEKNKFLNYLDSLNNYKQKIPDNAVKLINDLVSHFNNIKGEIDSVDQVTVNYINMVLAELLYELRLYINGMNNNQYNQLQGLVSTLMELTTESLSNTSFFHPFSIQKRSSLSSYKSRGKNDTQKIPLLKYPLNLNESDSGESLLAVIVKQLLPFDVIVWRNSKEPPYKPVTEAPDLTARHRIFYTLSKLYNHKNPEVNAKSSNRLASTIQVSIPSNTVFKFWALNMINHKTTNAEDVDLKDVLEHTKKVAPETKKPSIVIKVD